MMKLNKISYVCLGAFSALVIQTKAQSPTDYGNWFNYADQPASHWSTPMPFPPKSIAGGNENYTAILSPIEKQKLGVIGNALKEVLPKPKYGSYFFRMSPLYPNNLDKAKFAKRDYRFGYFISLTHIPFWVENGKISTRKIDWSGSMEASIRTPILIDFLSININHIPKFLGRNDHKYEGPTFDLEEDFTYIIKRTLENDKFKDTKTARSKDYVVSLTRRDDTFEDGGKYLGKENVPSINFGNDADKHFVYRNFSTGLLNQSGQFRIYGKNQQPKESHQYNTTDNMVVMSHNGKMPFTPITIAKYLEIVQAITQERIEMWQYYKNFNMEDYQKNKQTYDKNEAENVGKEQKALAFINSLREHYKDKLQQPAVVALAYSQLFNFRNYGAITDNVFNEKTGKPEPTNSIVSKYFVANESMAKAYYTYDWDFYKGMADGEIRSICVVWREQKRTPQHSQYQQGNKILSDRIDYSHYSDNPDSYLHQFNKKMDFRKLAAVLGK